MKIAAFLKQERITMECTMAERNPNMADDEWARTATHWRCVFTRRGQDGRRRMTTYFSQGSAICEEPTAADVLDCLASDASSLENAGGFEGWARDLGYGEDSIKALRTFETCESAAQRLATFLGPQENYRDLLWNTERA